MSEKISFDDCDVKVQILDTVPTNWIHADYDETNPEHLAYIIGRENIQPKLVAGQNIVIDSDTNKISAQVTLDQFPDMISQDTGNQLTTGVDGKLYAGTFIKNCGEVNIRANLPLNPKEFDSYLVKDENLFVFAHYQNGNLVWMPLSFYVDMNLYTTQEAFSTAMTNVYTNFGNYYTKNEADDRFVSKTGLNFDTTTAIVNLLYPVGGSQRFVQYPNAPTPYNQFGMGEWEIDTTMQGKVLVGADSNNALGNSTEITVQPSSESNPVTLNTLAVNYWKRIG